MNEFVHILFYKFYEFINTKYYSLTDKYYGNKITNDIKNKLTINYTSATHTFIIIPLQLIYFYYPNKSLFNFNKLFSMHYFINDTQNILSRINNFNAMDLFYLFHHLITIINLHPIKMNDLHSYWVIVSFFWGEVSNIPYFFVYHLLKTNGSKERIKQIKTIQKYHYSFIRVFIGAYCAYNYCITQSNVYCLYFTVTLYFIGIFFSYLSFIKK